MRKRLGGHCAGPWASAGRKWSLRVGEREGQRDKGAMSHTTPSMPRVPPKPPAKLPGCARVHSTPFTRCKRVCVRAHARVSRCRTLRLLPRLLLLLPTGSPGVTDEGTV